MKTSNVVIPLATTGICLIAYWLLLWITLGGVLEGWASLGIPPEKAVKLLGVNNTGVYVEVSNGRSYVCEDVSSVAEQCWREMEYVELPPDPYACDSRPSDILKPPGQIIDRIDVYACGIDVGGETNYAILADGSVWMRRHGSSGIFLGCLWLYGSQTILVVAFLLGLLVLKRYKSVNAA